MVTEITELYFNKGQKKLRCGITTGTCASAAAAAAAGFLLTGMEQDKVIIHTPKGITVEVPVYKAACSKERSEYFVIKDSGDDPDVTNGMKVCAAVEYLPYSWNPEKTTFQDKRFPWLYLEGGEGVGRVTRSGLEQEIGQAAINSVPRRMIFEAVADRCECFGIFRPMKIEVYLPQGKELASKTFNPILGIEGGLSVLGTSGILEPMSEKAIVDTIETQIRQLKAQGKTHLLITPGNYGQGYVSEYLKIGLEQSIKCSNYIGETIDLAVSYEMESLLLVGNIGKLVKLAAGIMNTHSKMADGRWEIVAIHAVLCGADRSMAEKLAECVTTEDMLEKLEIWGIRKKVMQSICRRIDYYVKKRAQGKLRIGVMLFSERFGYLGETSEARVLIQDCINSAKMNS